MNNKRVLFISYYTHQEEYFEKIKSVLETECKVYCLDATKALLKGFFKKSPNIDLDSKELDQMVNYSYQQFKISRGKRSDQGLNKLYNKILKGVAKLLYAYYYSFMKEKDIDLIIIWNGHRVQVTPALKAADNLKIKKLYLENGFFPNTIVADEKGVNANNSLQNKNKNFYQKVDLDSDKIIKLKEEKLEQRELRKDGLNKIREKLISEENINLPDNFVFLPFQVLTDSQIIINSPLINNMEELVHAVYEGLMKFNKNNNKDYWIVAKEHPSDFGKRDYSSLKNKYKDKNVLFLTKMEVQDLIELSEAVITINSTVGIEGLLKGKPVVTLGDAFYNVKDIVYNVDDLSELDEAIEEAVFSDLDHKLIDKFLYYLRYKYLIEADKKNANEDNVKPIVNKIKNLLKNTQ